MKNLKEIKTQIETLKLELKKDKDDFKKLTEKLPKMSVLRTYKSIENVKLVETMDRIQNTFKQKQNDIDALEALYKMAENILNNNSQNISDIKIGYQTRPTDNIKH